MLQYYPMEYPSIYSKFNQLHVQQQKQQPPQPQQASRGCLLWGPSGCGKTLLVKAIANKYAVNFINIKNPELLTMSFGKSKTNMHDIFEKAKNTSPCILFFDDLDTIPYLHENENISNNNNNNNNNNNGGNDVMKQLIMEIDKIKPNKQIFVIGATNRPDKIHPAIKQAGRLDQLIFIDLPDLSSRISILKIYLQKSPVACDVDFEFLAKHTHGYSGADLHTMVKIAAKLAIRQTLDKHTHKIT